MEQKTPIRVPPYIEELQKESDVAPISRELFLTHSSFAHQILDNTNPLWEYFLIDSHQLKKKAEMINYITEFLTVNFIFKSIVGKKKHADLYIFNNTTKYYDFVSKSQFCGEIDELFQGFPVLMGKYNTTNGVEIYDRIVNRNITKDETLDYYPELLPFLNGLYSFETQKFTINTPENFITKTLPYDRDETLDCPLFKKTIEEILPDPVKRKIVLTYLSYCLSGSIKLEVGHIWMGKKNNGKTKLCEFVIELLGDLGSSVAFESLAGDPGAICRTRGKRCNGAGEIGGDYLSKSAVDRAKRLITDKLMEGRDAYERHQKWKNQCKQIFPTNDLPNPRKCKKAFFRRWQIIFFLVDFTGKEDRMVFDRIYKNEAARVISYLLTFVPFWEEILVTDEDLVEQIWKNDALSTYQFIEEMCEIDRGYRIESSELYGVYGDWCLEQGKDAVSMKIFGSDLRQEGIYWTQLRDSTIEKGDNRVNYYVGIQLKDSTKEKIKQNNLADWCDDIEKTQEKLTPESLPKKKSEQSLKNREKILEQLGNLQDAYGKDTYFPDEDIFEPLCTWMDKDGYNTVISGLMKDGEIEVSKFGIRLGSR
jgi:P4 family phage/plasmid primase-like protien